PPASVAASPPERAELMPRPAATTMTVTPATSATRVRSGLRPTRWSGPPSPAACLGEPSCSDTGAAPPPGVDGDGARPPPVRVQGRDRLTVGSCVHGRVAGRRSLLQHDRRTTAMKCRRPYPP